MDRTMNSNKSAEQQNPADNEPDFDALMSLAMNDPEAFEAERRKYIESFLDSVPEDKRPRLQGLQWKVDQVRKLAKTPMASCIAISNMMKESLSKLRFQQIRLLAVSRDPQADYFEPEPAKATILPFDRH